MTEQEEQRQYLAARLASKLTKVAGVASPAPSHPPTIAPVVDPTAVAEAEARSHALTVLTLCAQYGSPERVGEFLAAGTPAEQVKRILVTDSWRRALRQVGAKLRSDG